MISNSYLTVFITASLRKFMDAQPFGIQKRWMQQGNAEIDDSAGTQDEVQFVSSIEFPRKGTMNEQFAVVHVQALVKTKAVATDVYYHTRVKARVADAFGKVIPLLKIGGDASDDSQFDKSQIGFLRPVPSETVKVTPTGVEKPDATVVEGFFELQLC